MFVVCYVTEVIVEKRRNFSFENNSEFIKNNWTILCAAAEQAEDVSVSADQLHNNHLLHQVCHVAVACIIYSTTDETD